MATLVLIGMAIPCSHVAIPVLLRGGMRNHPNVMVVESNHPVLVKVST